MITSPENRMKDIAHYKQHPFFNGIDWDKIRELTPPVVPKLDSETDTSYFHLTEEEKKACLSNEQEQDVPITSPILNIPLSPDLAKRKSSASYDVLGFSFDARGETLNEEKFPYDRNARIAGQQPLGPIRELSSDDFISSSNNSEEYSITNFSPNDLEESP